MPSSPFHLSFLGVAENMGEIDPTTFAVSVLQKAIAEVIRKSEIDSQEFISALRSEIQDILRELPSVPSESSTHLESLIANLCDMMSRASVPGESGYRLC